MYAPIGELGEKWINSNKKPSLFLTGTPGSGKTYFAIALLKGLIDLNIYNWLIFIKSDDLDNELLKAVLESNEAYVLEKYHDVPFLFIDDIGVERVNERIIKQYYSIIDRRLSNLLPTVFTSNLSVEQIGNTLGDRIASRLAMTTEVSFPKMDLRKDF